MPTAGQNLPGTIRTWDAVQSASASVPSDVDGLDLRDVRAVRLVISADSGQNLDGSGIMRAHIYDLALDAWVPVPALDLAVPGDAGGNQRTAWADIPIHVRSGYLAYITDSVAVDGGNVNVHLIGDTGPA